MKRTRLRVLAFFLSAVVLSFPLEITAQARDTATAENIADPEWGRRNYADEYDIDI